MLGFEDEPTVRNAIIKRLDRERGVEVHDIMIRNGGDHVAVGVLATLDHALVLRSRFDLPASFELRHVHNEIDEIAEQYKRARRDYWSHGRTLPREEQHLSGTGTRGRWAHYG